MVHNTAYVPGHLHLTVGSAVMLTFVGITYWLVPHLAGRPLWSRKFALAQVWLWVAGVLLFSPALHELGLRGMPRRTMMGHAAYMQADWKTLLPLVGIGGSLMFLSMLAYFLNMVLTVTVSRRAEQPALPFAEALSGPDHAPSAFDRWRPWLVTAGLLVALAYGPTLLRLAVTTPLNTPGLRVW